MCSNPHAYKFPLQIKETKISSSQRRGDEKKHGSNAKDVKILGKVLLTLSTYRGLVGTCWNTTPASEAPWC